MAPPGWNDVPRAVPDAAAVGIASAPPPGPWRVTADSSDHFLNPSTMEDPPPPCGYWHMIWHPNGSLTSSTRHEYRKVTVAQLDEYVDTMGGGKGKAFGKGQQAFDKGQQAFGKGYPFGQGKGKGEGKCQNAAANARAKPRARAKAKGQGKGKKGGK